MRRSRRKFLAAFSFTTTLGLFGCQGILSEDDSEPELTSTPSRTPTPVATPRQTATPTETATETPAETPTSTPSQSKSPFRVDFVPWTNQAKLEKLRNVTPNGWVEEHRIKTPDTRVVKFDGSESQADDIQIDLTALQLHHHDSYTEWDWVEKAVEAIDNPESLELENERPTALYPNGDGGVNNILIEEMRGADTYEDFHLWSFAFLSNYEYQVRNERLHSTKDKEYAAFLQETVNRYAENFDAHVWEYNTGFGVHGFMSVYSKADDEVRMEENIKTLDTVGDSPIQGASWEDPKLIEESPYTDPDSEFWHPVRFAEGDYNGEFWYAKKEATAMFTSISGNESRDRNGELYSDPNFALTTGFVEDVAEGIGTYNLEENNYEFETDIRNNALVVEKLRRTDRQFIVDEVDYTADEITPVVYDVTDYEGSDPLSHEYSDELLEKVWEDEAGLFNNFGDVVSEFDQNDEYDTLEQAAKALS